MPNTHPKVAPLADSTDTTILRPSDWNANHLGPAWTVLNISDAAAQTWTNMPLTLTEFRGLTIFRNRADLRYATEARIIVNIQTAGLALGELRVQYSTDNGTTWAYLDGVDGPKITTGTADTIHSSWVILATAARVDNALLRIVGINGDGIVDPVFGLISVRVR